MAGRLTRAAVALGVALLAAVPVAGAGPFALPDSVAIGPVDWHFDVSAGSPGGLTLSDATLLGTGQIDAFDDFWLLSVNGVPFTTGGTVDLLQNAIGATLTSPALAMSGLIVTQQFFVSATQPVVRVLVTVENPTGAPVTADVTLRGKLGSDAGTVVVATSSGDAAASEADRWTITSDGGRLADPVVGTVVAGPDPLRVQPVLLSVAADQVMVRYLLPIPGVSRRRLVLFSQLSPDAAMATGAIALFDTQAAAVAAGLFAGLDPSQRAEIANWSFGALPNLAIGADAGGGPHVLQFNAALALRATAFAYVSSFLGGVRVAVGDVDGDGVQDLITGAGPGGGPHVRVFSGATGAELRSFFAFDPAFTGGVYVAAGDVDGDGQADIITGAGAGGGPHVRVFSGATGAELWGFFAYPADFTGGVRVGAGDVDADGLADIITGAGPGIGPHVQVFSGRDLLLLRSFFAYNPRFDGGVFVAADDVDGDGHADIVTGAGEGGGPHVKVFGGARGNELYSFFAYHPAFTGGVRVATIDVDLDGRADIVTGAGPGGGPHVRIFSGAAGAQLHSFFAFDPAFSGGVFVGGH